MSLAVHDSSYVRALVRERSAIVLDEGKEYLLESRLAPIVRREDLDSIGDLVGQLRSQPFGDLHARVVEAMTTNETSFFRDAHPFDALQDHIVPELIERRAGERRLRIWCAACSSGQEPYSVAMLLRDRFPELQSWDVEILGTDLSTEMLERARDGAYTTLEVNRGLPARQLVQNFEQAGPMWRIKAPLREMAEFRVMNLIEPWPLLPKMDIVFMRNVLIYFDTETKQDILAQIRRVLRPDGSLFLGASETTLNLDPAFERVAYGRASCYRIQS
ncbi:CheR family methyltransferase [Rubrivirga litoralis]|uniref:protein-glutamate O-methyltransferase n=1 Tax=Rubrivirga litoralis TaxID=3075598 RepID=A0ABU3BPM5_9BACT|nr:protein-glutamate O-methyltransferase CheR [Rubrivirga sp. F394]MDT0631246.1 protein-glutamate O-methyltransferase CheR [Rubrivirga sp. F394]